MRFTLLFRCFVFGCMILGCISESSAQSRRRANAAAPAPVPVAAPVGYDSSFFAQTKFRFVGPNRGGRSAAVTGVAGNPYKFYFGATGGGVFQSNDAGQSWRNISDGFFGGSMGAVAVSEWDNNVIYAGGGEVTVRGNVSHGDGMFKSTDAGKTWQSIGLKDSRHITRIRIHPKNADLVYASVLGHLSGANDERGVYRSKDGGKTWERILFVNNEVGAVNLAMDATNPRILYASMWRVKRTPYSLESGGEGSSIWKSTDGGDTWKDISKSDGMPKGIWGISDVTISPANPDRVWALIEAEEGGVYRSDDGGKSWRKVNADRNLRQRAWYYTRIFADPKNAEQVYVLNVEFWKSKDGGRTFSTIDTPHGDHHDLWIDPTEPLRMIIGDDGGAQVTVDGGMNWSNYDNQPTAQFYRVTTDNHFPYRIYGAQQDNSSVRVSSTGGEWENTSGGESGWIAVDPNNDEIVYGGNYGGYLTRLNHRTGQDRDINAWPDNPMGHGAIDLKHRFQWNFPIVFSRHDPKTLYTASQVLFKTTNEGQTWTPISGDLTRNDPKTLQPSGGPITKDNTSVEYYGTIFSMAEGIEAGTIWTGSDDGLIHLSRDGGKTWTNVTPPSSILPEWAQINALEAHPFENGGLYVAATRYKSDDFKPYLFKTTDYGKTWTKITSGINDLHFTRVVRADPSRRGLLYAGTERGLYLSFDDGAHWEAFQKNLPIVPITDITLKNNDLIIATQGRAFWILDDVTILHQLEKAKEKSQSQNQYFFQPRPTYRAMDANPSGGVVLNYWFKTMPDSAATKLYILDPNGKVIKKFAPKAKDKMPLKVGMNRFVWNMRYPDAERFDGMILWAGGVQGPRAIAGKYAAALVVGKDSTAVPFEILGDPRTEAKPEDLKAQFDFLIEVRDKLTETHKAILQIRRVRESIKGVVARSNNDKELKKSGDALAETLTKIEEALYQTKNQSGQDPLNYPIRLNNRLSALVSSVSQGDFPPTDQAIVVKNELTALINAELGKLKTVLTTDVKAFNELVATKNIPAVKVD